MSSPADPRRAVIGRTHTLLRDFVHEHPLGTVWDASGHPDADLIFLTASRASDGRARQSPDLAVIVVTVANTQTANSRIQRLLQGGSHTVWAIYPENQIVYVFEGAGRISRLTAEKDLQCPELLPGFHIGVSALLPELS